MAKEQSPGGFSDEFTNEATDDLAAVLVAEFSIWFQNLGTKGILPRAFTGVTKGDKQVVTVLTSLPLDHIQRKQFLVWLCRNERFVAYAYGTHVEIAQESWTVTEGFDIFASSNRYDVGKTLRIERREGTIQFFVQHHAVRPAKQENELFYGLQQSNEVFASDNEALFRELWADLKSKSMWRQR